ncbi:MAG: dihydropteroate synthase [Candidatus Electryonea clarkiae]|nr:dihydropteroate synthase [Candidatus Electryonea clarkiae]MDP8289059.1 dihydropteroate synthase [Candidatus Electryonea clarkiae]
MGIVNVTPDSFYDGGMHDTIDSAVAHGIKLADDGAAVLDVGGESTRPGSDEVTIQTELERVIPVISKLAEEVKIPISIDTRKAEVAKLAIEAGASIINDVSAGEHDPEIIDVAAENDVYYIAMHMRGKPKTMQKDIHYDELISDLKSYFNNRERIFLNAGLRRDKLILDPGIGFGKSAEDNYTVLANLNEFRELGYPLVVGPSRKSFLAPAGGSLPENRLSGTLAAVTVCALEGVELVRVHDVAEVLQAINVALRIKTIDKKLETK